jgi:rod shape determining protein RodA
LLVLLYFFLLLRIIRIGERQRSTFSRVYAYSVASILFFHVFINIYMTIGLMPVIGITLPFLSYGGSSLLTFTTLIFILLRLDLDRQTVLR